MYYVEKVILKIIFDILAAKFSFFFQKEIPHVLINVGYKFYEWKVIPLPLNYSRVQKST